MRVAMTLSWSVEREEELARMGRCHVLTHERHDRFLIRFLSRSLRCVLRRHILRCWHPQVEEVERSEPRRGRGEVVSHSLHLELTHTRPEHIEHQYVTVLRLGRVADRVGERGVKDAQPALAPLSSLATNLDPCAFGDAKPEVACDPEKIPIAVRRDLRARWQPCDAARDVLHRVEP